MREYKEFYLTHDRVTWEVWNTEQKYTNNLRVIEYQAFENVKKALSLAIAGLEGCVGKDNFDKWELCGEIKKLAGGL